VSEHSLGGVRVLVVDDDAAVGDAVGDYLIDCGAEVVSVRAAEAAILRLAESRPHVVLSDIGMPHRDGFWLIRTVRALPAEQGRDLPVIAMTGRLDTSDALLAAGFTEVRSKPPDMAELAALVAALAIRG
jgi:CheY-like chemotaxis protein